MFNGPGKYDNECTLARIATNAEGVALIVFNGEHGNGFSVQASLEQIMSMPGTLRSMADQIEAMQPKEGDLK